ncbi:MAG: hypothetical protein R3350_03920 [Saprospiraceae bacterium]|nr:hypothetical protein [Saprospiraceae bacterium]
MESRASASSIVAASAHGLGASAISDSWDGYVQNEKTVERYRDRILQGAWPIMRGHLLSSHDQCIRTHILNIMCLNETRWEAGDELLQEPVRRLKEFAKDKLIELNDGGLRVLPAGRPFLRNICLAFDAHYWRRQPEGKLFSEVV